MVPHVKTSILFLLLLVLTAAACQPFASSIHLPIAQPTSPLIPGETLGLADARWQVREIIYQDQVISFAAIQPIRVEMGVSGYLQVSMTGCNTITFRIAAESERHYQLVDGMGTQMLCPEPANSQSIEVFNALLATTELELVGTQLRLTGVSTRIVLEPLRPMLPGDDVVLMQSPWHLVQFTRQCQVMALDTIQPTSLAITPEGYLTVQAGGGCGTLTFLMHAKDERQYQFYGGSTTMAACNEAAILQMQEFVAALGNTHEMEIKGNQLLLTGELIEIVWER